MVRKAPALTDHGNRRGIRRLLEVESERVAARGRSTTRRLVMVRASSEHNASTGRGESDHDDNGHAPTRTHSSIVPTRPRVRAFPERVLEVTCEESVGR